MRSGFLSLSFNERADRMLARVQYRKASTVEDRAAIYRMRHDGYVRDGGIAPIEGGLFHDAWDETENVELIGVYLDDQLAASVRIHVSGDDAGIPSAEPFGDLVQPYLDAGLRLVDATRFVIDYRHAAFSAEMPFLTLRAVAMAAEHFNAFGLLAAVRQEHSVVYRRVTGHRLIGGPRTYPLLRKPIVCMIAETADLDCVPYRKHPFLRSTREEREKIFGMAPICANTLACESMIRVPEALALHV